MAKRAKVKLYKAKNGEFSWRVRAPNGKIVSIPGETFTTELGAKEAFPIAVAHMIDAYARLVEEQRKNG